MCYNISMFLLHKLDDSSLCPWLLFSLYQCLSFQFYTRKSEPYLLNMEKYDFSKKEHIYITYPNV